MSETTEIKAELRVDDHASAALERVKEGFGHLGHMVTDVAHEMGSLAKQALATAVGFQLSGAIDSMKELGHEVFGAAMGAREQQKALAGLLSMTDRTGASMYTLTQDAVQLHGELEGMGIAAGVATDQVIDAFAGIAERSNKTTEEVKAFTEEMAQAGRAVPGGIGSLAGGFEMIQAGMIRARNPVVTLIAATGVLHGNAKQVAKQLQKMTPDKALELGEKAIAKMAKRAKDMPPSFSELVQSLKDIRENLFEAMGVPILKVLGPPLMQLKDYFVAHREELEIWAERVGTKIGDWLVKAADKMKQGFEYLETHADEIQKAITDGAETARKAFQFIIDHKEAIAMAFGAYAATKVATGAVGAVGTAATAIEGAGGFGALAKAAWTASAAVGNFGNMSLSLAGVGPAMAKFGASLTSMGWNVAILGQAMLPALATVGAFAAAGAAIYWAVSEWNKLSAMLDRDRRQTGDAMVEYVNRMQEVSFTNEAYQQALSNTIAKGDDLAASMMMAAMAARVFAQEAGDLKERRQVKEEADIAERSTLGYLGAAQEYLRTGKHPGGVKPAPSINNFNGGQTFNIKQDFRDQDPDRIALVFHQDVLKAAESRKQALTGYGAFGG